MAPPSKSEAHRALIAASMADNPTIIHNLPGELSDDLAATMKVMHRIFATEFYHSGDIVTVVPNRNASRRCVVADCNESGTTLRLTFPLVGALLPKDGCVTFVGHGRLPQRPMAPQVDAMVENGITCNATYLPLTISGRLKPGVYSLPGNISSQYISGLLFALPLLEGDSVIKLTTPLESGDYIGITTEVLHKFGINVEEIEGGWRVPGNQHYHSPGEFQVLGDWSNSALWMAVGAVNPKPITLRGLDHNSHQGDRKIVDFLRQYGAEVTVTGDSVTVCNPTMKPLNGIEINIRNTPDLMPVLAMLSTACGEPTRFTNAYRLRYKETDRLATSADLISDLGGTYAQTLDGLIVDPGSLIGGVARSQNDHRLVMAAIVGAHICMQQVTIEGAEACRKSYPSLWDDYAALGGKVQ
jgi:3-phosphoshikimate 1-carboxyvinyltransferase